jgi:hypothetical protein
MNGKTKAMLKLRLKFQQFGLAIFFFGLALFINRIPGGKMITLTGGMLYALSRVFRAFEPVYHEPEWELVYPELAVGEKTEMNNIIDKTEDYEK